MKIHPLSICLVSLLVGSFAWAGKCEPGTTPIFEIGDAALEGITVTKDGTIYASGDDTGKIFKRTRDGAVAEVAALWNDDSGAVLGLTTDHKRNVYAAVNSFVDGSIHGVWRLGKDDSVELMANFPLGTLLNGITMDHRNVLYVSDSYGGIWTVSKDGVVDLWIEHELFLDSFGFGFGLNGLDYFHGSVYGAITLDGRIVRVPINPDGSAGTPENYVVSDLLFGVDQAIFDPFGNLYAVNVWLHTLVKVDRDLLVTNYIENSPDIFKPASMSLGRPGDMFTIYITNYENAGEWFPTEPRNVADVVKISICPPGLTDDDSD